MFCKRFSLMWIFSMFFIDLYSGTVCWPNYWPMLKELWSSLCVDLLTCFVLWAGYWLILLSSTRLQWSKWPLLAWVYGGKSTIAGKGILDPGLAICHYAVASDVLSIRIATLVVLFGKTYGCLSSAGWKMSGLLLPQISWPCRPVMLLLSGVSPRVDPMGRPSDLIGKTLYKSCQIIVSTQAILSESSARIKEFYLSFTNLWNLDSLEHLPE